MNFFNFFENQHLYILFAVITGAVSFLPATFSLFTIYMLDINIIKLPKK